MFADLTLKSAFPALYNFYLIMVAMMTFKVIRLFCLSLVIVSFECFKQLPSSRIIRCDPLIRMSSASSATPGSMLSRVASVIVGSTMPFIFQLDFGGIEQDRLTFSSPPQHAQADSTGKVDGFRPIDTFQNQIKKKRIERSDSCFAHSRSIICFLHLIL